MSDRPCLTRLAPMPLALLVACAGEPSAPSTSPMAAPPPVPSGASPEDAAAPAPPRAPDVSVLHRSLDGTWEGGPSAFWGDELAVRVAGASPGALVEVRATSAAYTSVARYVADARGEVDTTTSAAVEGDYVGVDGDGLLWSMRPAPGREGSLVDFAVAFSATSEGWDAPRVGAVTRTWTPAGATEIAVRDGGLVGAFVAPKGERPRATILLLGGSEGGLSTALSAGYWAGRGYATLALAYFAAPGLPGELRDIPVEYVGRALAWLGARPEVDPARLAVMGWSRGGELALLVGATFPEVRAVVGVVPSGYAWGAVGDREAAAWTVAGAPVPFVPSVAARPGRRTDAEGRAVDVYAPTFLAAIDAATPDQRAAATIPVERTSGPVLLVGGAADELWPSCALAEVAARRLAERGHSARYADTMRCYADAGHLVAEPGMPTLGADAYASPGTTRRTGLGGTPAGIARAGRAADADIQRFLAAAFGAP